MSWNALRKIGDSLRGPNPLSTSSNSSSNDEANIQNIGDAEPFKTYQSTVQTIESDTKKILRNSRKLSEAISNLNRNQVKLTKDLSNSHLCQVYDPDLRSLTENWHSFHCQLSDGSNDISGNISKTITDPVKKINKLYEEVRANLKKREELLRSISKLQEKVAKLSEKEKTGNTLVNLQKTKNLLEATQNDLRNLEATLIREIPPLLDYRVQLLQPSLEAFVRSELSYWGDNLSALASNPALTRSVDDQLLQSLPHYQKRQEQLINAISVLSIVDGSN